MIGEYNQIEVDNDKWEKSNTRKTWDDLAYAFNIDRQQIYRECTEESHQIVITCRNSQQLRYALEDIPSLKDCVHSQELSMVSAVLKKLSCKLTELTLLKF